MTNRPLILNSLFTSIALAFSASSGCVVVDQSSSADSSGASTSGSTGGGSTGSSSSSGGGAGGGQESAFHVAGSLSYEYVPYDTQLDGLDYTAIATRPIRGASVRLLDADTSVEVAKTVSDDKGAYSFAYDGPARVKLWIYSETEDPVITVEDNTSKDEVYVLESDAVDSAAMATLDVLAKSGWDGAAYSDPRASAPFAVLDATYTAARRFLTEISPPPSFPPLKVNWSVNNRPEDGDVAKGEIGTSNWDGEELYLLGKADVDTDEFDSHVIVHEWGHYFESNLSRSDSVGGGHGYGDVLDPRVAFSEGFCNALSAMILDPDTIYADSSGLQQADGFIDDLEKNDLNPDSSPGWFSEETVGNVAFDFYDSGASEPFDKVSLGLKGIYEAMVGGHKTTPALTTLFSFVSALKAKNPQDAPAIDAIIAHHTIDAQFGTDVIKDDWATGETHAGGVAPGLPLYAKAPIGGTYFADFIGGPDYNTLAQNRYFQIPGDGKTVTIQSSCPKDVDLYVFHVGEILEMAESNSGDETVTFDTKAGEIYILNVEGYTSQAAPYSAQIDVTH